MLLPSVFENDFFDDFLGEKNIETMKTDIKELSGSYSLRIDLPGTKKEDINLSVRNGYLFVRAVTNKEAEEKDKEGRFIRRERYSGSVSRSFYVGEDVEPENVKANFTDGVLEIIVPKVSPKEKEKDYKIKIEG